LARHRTKGANALWLLWGFSKVTRCKSETISGRYQKNGYTHGQRFYGMAPDPEHLSPRINS
ncbi:hypothetical protein, partial [Pseudomonas sp. GM67]|uniref:hypothetical protein n=1 Tax=Pseudomonas sp. GM67 TaxID=1144335 RepID=UPI001EE66EA2